MSFGSTSTGSRYVVVYQGGSLIVYRDSVSTAIDDKKEATVIGNKKTGVPPEVRGWGEALALGKTKKRQISGEALAELGLVIE